MCEFASFLLSDEILRSARRTVSSHPCLYSPSQSSITMFKGVLCHVHPTFPYNASLRRLRPMPLRMLYLQESLIGRSYPNQKGP